MRSNNLPASEVRPKRKSRFMTNYDYSIYYKRYHDGSPEDIERMALVYKKMLLSLLLPYPRSTKVLDYGCGDGALVNYLSRHFDDVFGVDASKEQIETGIRNGVNIEYLPLKNFEDWCESNAGTYDIVFTFDVLEHVPVADQIPFLRHLAMLLKPGGVYSSRYPMPIHCWLLAGDTVTGHTIHHLPKLVLTLYCRIQGLQIFNIFQMNRR